MIYPILSNFRQALLTDKKKGTKYVITDQELFKTINDSRTGWMDIEKRYSNKFSVQNSFNEIENALSKYIEKNKISYDNGDLILVTNDDFDAKYYFLCTRLRKDSYSFYHIIYATFINEDYIIDRTLSGVDYKYLKTFDKYKDEVYGDYNLAFDLYNSNVIEAYPKNALTKTASAEIIEDCLTNNLSLDSIGIEFYLEENQETQSFEQPEEEIKEVVKQKSKLIASLTGGVLDIQKIDIGKYNNDTDVIVESSGNLISYIGYELCFLITYENKSYETSSNKALIFVSRKKKKDIFIRKNYNSDSTIVRYKSASSLNDLEYEQIKNVYTNLLAELDTNKQKEENQKAYDNAVKVVESNEQVIENKPQTTIEEIVAPVSNPIDKKEDSFWEEAERILSEELTKEEEETTIRKKKETEKAKKEKVEKNKEKIANTKDVSEEEFVIASKETLYEPEIMVEMKIPNVSASDINKSIKIKEEKYKSQTKITPDDYPADWNYIYSIKETSKMYNPTIFSDGEKGMTLEEWNAYFLAHPELGHLVEETIGDFGGIIYSEKDLMDMGLLLYNPETQKIQYKYEYLTGNTYTLLENFESAYQQVVDMYGEDFFEIQKQAIINATPQPKSYDSADIEKQPYIHPLDEVVIDFKINSAADIQFPVNKNSKLVAAIKKVYAKDISKIEEELNGIQSLSLVNFFREWLISQTGKLGNYGLKDIELVDEGYFKSLSYSSYVNYLLEQGYQTQINPATNLPFDIKDEITESDFFEVKESIKSFVNDLFQDFVRDIISIDDKNNLLYAWNKKYNGFAKIDIYKFPVFIKHAKYIKDRTKKIEFKLSDTQIEGIKFATINNSSIIAHEVGYGKMQPLDSKLLTAKGWIKMGDVKIGDSVISVDGKPTKVLGIYPHGKQDIYKITFDDGSSTECGGEHLWTVIDTTRKNKNRGWITLTTNQLLDKNLKIDIKANNTNQKYKFSTYYKEKVGNMQRNKWQIPVVEPVHFDKKELPIHPYLLGVLIGDGSFGSKGTIGLTSADEHIVEKIKLLLPNDELEVKQVNSTTRNKIQYTISRNKKSKSKTNEMTLLVNKLGLTGKHADNKFIPEVYKFSSVESRIQLLQGLMDTDGTTKLIKGRDSSQLSYCTVSKKLCEDFVFLINSLGGIATVYKKKTSYTYNGEKKNGKLAYIISINIPPHILPFTLSRKLEKHIPKHKYKPARFISNIEYIGKKEAQCIKVEHESHLYVTDDFIVTHNTLTSIGFMSHIFETNQANNIMVLVPKSLYANKKWKEEISGNIDIARNRTILGAVPQYNLIEMNNFSTTYVFNDGEEGGPKTYTDDEIKTIRSFYQYITEIGGTIKGRKLRSNPTAKGLLPTNINYSRSVAYWTKVINDLKNIDLNLFNRSIGRNGELQQLLLSILASNAGSKSQNDIINVFTTLYETIFLKTEFEIYYPGIIFDRTNPPREFIPFLESELSAYKYKKDKDGKVVRKDGERVEIPANKIAEAYILGKLEEIHYWLNTTLQKMSDFAIYEYGTWNFPIGKKNIILATRDSLENLGFSSNSREDIIKVIKEITEYKYEQTTDIAKDVSYTYVDNQGVKQVFTRKPQTVLSRQLEDLIGKIENYMTEEGDYGKFFLNNLGIDGFILDEAHLAKKIFTNVKTDKRMDFELPTGQFASMVVSSHDIKGGSTPPRALRVFGVSQYIRSLGEKKPLMLLTATPFSNQPTEIFSMLSIVGIKQLRQQGISNIKNFFDLFLKESLKYDFDHKGNFIKRITVEDFRNKELLANVIWSVIDIKREASIKDSEDKKNKKGAKPNKFVLPKLSSDASIEDVDTGSSEDKELDKQLKDLTSVSTVAVINRMSTNTCSIVDRNSIQTKMMKDIESVITDEINTKTGRPFTFQDVCPNFELIAEIEEEEQEEDDKKRKKKKADDKKKSATEAIAKDNSEYGKVFKAMGMSRSLCLSPYFFSCNDLPYPTPENVVKYSPKIEYLVKAIESVKNYHIRKNQEISGQLAYFNMIRFKYYYKKDGKAVVETFNLLELIKEYLVSKGVFKANEIAIFSSDTSDDKKEDYIKGFQDGNIKVFFGTPAMREGVDLQHKGSTLYVMTPDWNPTDMRQIEGRIWRRDNEYKWVRIIYVLLDQSIEVFIYAKLEEKARRLQQIMKERNSIEELQEMSLNPYQTKIALTTDPEKRADIITKLSEIVWIEKKNKLAQAKTAIQASEDNMAEIKSAIDIAYKKYFKPFNEKFPAISQSVTDYKIKQIAEDRTKSPAKFINKYFAGTDPIVNLPVSEITKYHAAQVYLMGYNSYDMQITAQGDVNYLYTLPGEGPFPLLDYFRIIKLFAENHNNQEYKDFLNLPSISERINFIMNKYPLWLSPLPVSHNTIAAKIASDYYSVGGFATAMNVLNRLTQQERDTVIQICDKVESSFGQGAKSRNEIIAEITPLVEILNEEIYTASESGNALDEISISMTIKYREIMNNKFKPISEQDFMSAKFLEKVNMLTKLQTSIEDYERNLYSLPKDTREKIMSKTNKYPTYLDILPQLRLGKDPKQSNDLDTILVPISNFRSTLRDTYEEFLKPNNLDFDDIDYLSRKVQREYSDIEDKLKQIQELKVKLVERYKKVNEERKDITIDDVIKQFGLTNSFLDEKLND